MATDNQIAANRENAQLSTGPRTPNGKSTVSQNATRHALTSKGLIILPGQESDFAQIESDLRTSLHPATPLQEIIFSRALQGAWNLHRCRLAEGHLYDTKSYPLHSDPLIQPHLVFLTKNIERYARSAENSLYKAMRELGRLQSEEHFREETQPEHPPASEVCSVIQITPKVARLRRHPASRNKPNFTLPHRDELTDFSPGDPTCGQRDAA